MNKVKMGVIGCGMRGTELIGDVLSKMPDLEIIAVCDNYADRVEAAQNLVEKTARRPFGTTEYTDVLNMESVDAVLISTSWETHVEIAIAAMRKGIAVALEVGGAYSVDPLWDMVRTQQSTGTPFMFMENCCYGKDELLATSLARNGLLGEIVYAHGGYAHYLCDHIAGGEINRHYRLRNYLSRNCENYPMHALGPIAKVLNVNRGNQMISLVSVASKAAGMPDFISRHADQYPDLVGKEFRQGDIVNTTITCANGATITLRLDTTLPRSYSREFTLRGTRGLYTQDLNAVYLEGEQEYGEPVDFARNNLNNATRYEADYLPDCWSKITPEEIAFGHGGMDGIDFRQFINALKNKTEMPIDVYDAAAWMSITALSEKSIAMGGMPQAIPDFTGGLWTVRKPKDVIEIPIVEK